MQLEKRMIKKGLYALVSLGGIHVLAMFLGLYWIFPDFDIPMHFLGGIWLGFMATWFVIKFKIVKKISSFSYLLWVAIVVLAVGLGWEVFEYSLDQITNSRMQLSLVDTQLDLVMDLLGGYVIALGVLIMQLNNENNG